MNVSLVFILQSFDEIFSDKAAIRRRKTPRNKHRAGIRELNETILLKLVLGAQEFFSSTVIWEVC